MRFIDEKTQFYKLLYKHNKNIYTTVTVFAWVAVLKPLQVRRFPLGGDIFIKYWKIFTGANSTQHPALLTF